MCPLCKVNEDSDKIDWNELIELCDICKKLYHEFMRIQAPIIATEFMLYVLRKGEASRKIKLTLQRRVEEGAVLGRPRVHDYDKINTLRNSGMSYRKVARELGVSMGAIRAAQRCLK